MSALLKVDDVWMRFGGLVALQKLSFEVNEGELVGLIGPNGAGKTTCFNILTGLYEPTTGSITFRGNNIAALAPHRCCRVGIARTFQNIRLFKQMTVLENILVSLHRKRGYSLFSALSALPLFKRRESELRDRAMAYLKAMGIEDRAQTLARNLPYGEQRKVEIARALATEPQLLLLDEPAAGMNPFETAQLAELILKVRADYKLTVLLIEHDMSLVMKICERIYVLDYGQLIASGPPQTIQNDPRVIEAYLGGSLEGATP